MRASQFGIYVHWPFCVAKCPYCDFNSHVRVHFDEDRWIRAIASELRYVSSRFAESGHEVSSVFFGGGTPSLMTGRAVDQVLTEIAGRWVLVPDAEITLEANPSSADAARFRDYRAAGINRLSVGVQALNDRDLKFLGRLHNAAEASDAIALAASVFDRVSLDLIYARPKQDFSSWREELNDALAFGTSHLSLYQLTIEDGTPFAALARSGALVPACEDITADLYEVTQDIMGEAGLPAYEISNHARAGEECRHNLLYWRYGNYAGVGPGAHGRLGSGGTRIATRTERLPERWLAAVESSGHGYTDIVPLSNRDAAREHLLMNLRLEEGIDTSEFHERWGWKPGDQRIEGLIDDGFLERRGTRLAATRAGRLVLNAVISELNDVQMPTSRATGMSLAAG